MLFHPAKVQLKVFSILFKTCWAYCVLFLQSNLNFLGLNHVPRLGRRSLRPYTGGELFSNRNMAGLFGPFNRYDTFRWVKLIKKGLHWHGSKGFDQNHQFLE